MQYASPLAAASLPRRSIREAELQAPRRVETARLFRIVGVAAEALRAFAIVLMVAPGFRSSSRSIPRWRSAATTSR
jgi:hypothetical protein